MAPPKKAEKPAEQANLKFDRPEDHVTLIVMIQSNGAAPVLEAIAALKAAGKDFTVTQIKRRMEGASEDDDE